jgi:hypothetical protein
MTRSVLWAALTGSAMLMSGCSLVDAMHTASVYDSMSAANVLYGPPTDAAALGLRTGQATYTGLGTVTASNGQTVTAYLGDATVNVDFDTARLSGDISMYSAKGGLDAGTDPQAFFDQVQADPTNFLLSMSSSSGHVALTGGSVADGSFVVTATSGDLKAGGTTAVVTGGTVTGEFTGADGNGLRSTGSAVTGTINGAAADQIAVYFAAAE